MAVKKKGKKGLTVDFSGVESGGKAVPDGAYEVEVVEVTEEVSSDDNAYLKWKFKITDGEAKGAVIFDNTSLQPQALWRLKGLLETLGEEVPDSAMELDLASYEGTTLTITVANEEFQGRDRPKVAAYGGKAGSTEAEPDTSTSTTTRKKKGSTTAETKFKVSQKVTFNDEGKDHKGKILKIDGETATVEVGEEEWEIELTDLSAA